MFAGWWYSASLLENEIRRQVAAAGWEIQELLVPRFNGWPLIIKSAVVVNSNLQISINAIRILPAGDFLEDWRVSADTVEISNAVTADPVPPSSRADTIAALNEIVRKLPMSGFIDTFSVCPENCIDAHVSWRHLEDQSHRAGRPVIALSLEIRNPPLATSLIWSPDSIDLSLTSRDPYLALVDAQLRSNAGTITMLWTGSAAPGTEPLVWRSDTLSVDIDSLAGHGTLSVPVPGGLTFDDLIGEISGDFTVNTMMESLLQRGSVSLTGNQALPVTGTLTNGTITITQDAPAQFELHYPGFEQSSIRVAAGSRCNLANAIACHFPEVLLQTSYEDWDIALKSQVLDFKWDSAVYELGSHADLQITKADKTWLTTELTVHADPRKLIAEASQATVSGLPGIDFILSQDLLTGAGYLDANVRRPARDARQLLTQLFAQPGKADLLIQSGRLGADLDLVWSDINNISAASLDVFFMTSDLNLTIGDYRLSGGSLEARLTGWPELKSSQPVTMSWATFDPGVPVTAVRARFDLDFNFEQGRYLLSGQQLDANVFRGELSSQHFDYDFGRQSGYAMLNLTALHLDQILALQPDEFESSGKISGSVPVQIDSGKLAISNGKVTALAPGGFIKYKAGATVINLAEKNEQLKLVVDTMSDFQYHYLDADLIYTQDGNLIARTSLQGKNPAYQNGREIKFNLNVEQNIASLLKSLRLNNDVSKKLDSRARGGVIK